jgi:hypothetical protein
VLFEGICLACIVVEIALNGEQPVPEVRALLP